MNVNISEKKLCDAGFAKAGTEAHALVKMGPSQTLPMLDLRLEKAYALLQLEHFGSAQVRLNPVNAPGVVWKREDIDLRWQLRLMVPPREGSEELLL